MLPPFIIEQIRQREEQRQKPAQPRLELPLEIREPASRERDEEEEAPRGVAILDLG